MAAVVKNSRIPKPPVFQDTTPPSNPANLAVTLNSGIPTIVWDASTDNVGIDFYAIHREVVIGGIGQGYSQIASTTTAVYVDNTVSPNTVYHYKVLAFDTSSNPSAAFSNVVTATIPAGSTNDVTAPNVPATPTFVSKTASSVTMSVAYTTDQVVGGAVTSGPKEYNLRRGTTLLLTKKHPTGFQDIYEGLNIGSAGGSSSMPSTTLTMTATGPSWYNSADSLRIFSGPVTGDFTYQGRITSFSSAYEWAKGGIEIRDGLDPTAKHISAIVFQTNGMNDEFRKLVAGPSDQGSRDLTYTVFPIWVRVVRTGSLFSIYKSTNGSSWTLHDSQTIDMSDTVEVGWGCSAQDDLAAAYTATMVVDNIAISLPTTFSFTDTGLSALTLYTHNVNCVDYATNASAYSSNLSTTTDVGVGASVRSGLGFTAIDGSPRNYGDDGYIAHASKMDAVIFGFWDGAQSSQFTKTHGQWTAAVKAQSVLPNKTTILAYFEPHFAQGPSPGGVDNELWSKCDAQGWWLFNNGTSGSKVGAFWNPALPMFNLYYPAMSGLVDSNGENIYVFLMKYFLDYNILGGALGRSNGGNSAAPDVTGMNMDDLLHEYSVTGGSSFIDGDFNRDGTKDFGSNTSWKSGLRDGLKYMFTWLNANYPALKTSANISQFQHDRSVGNETQYLNMLDYGYNEACLGPGNATESWGDTTLFKTWVTRAARVIKPGGTMFFAHNELDSLGRDPTDSVPYRAGRLGFCWSRLLEPTDRYYAFSQNAPGGSLYDRLWLDEWSVNMSTGAAYSFSNANNGLGWWGPAVDSTYTVLANGVHIRRYQNAIFLVNPKGNGDRTFTLGGSTTYQRITGTQDSSLNNGGTVTPSTSITMLNRTGLVLRRIS